MSAHSRRMPFARSDWPLVLLALAVLALGLFYTLSYVAAVPYPGLEYSARWEVGSFDDLCLPDAAQCTVAGVPLRAGDTLRQIGALTHEQYLAQRLPVPFDGYHPGDAVPIVFERQGTVLTTVWRMVGPTAGMVVKRSLTFLIFLPFWLAGAAVLLFLRPRDERWGVLIAFNFVTATWIATGFTSTYRVGGSAIALHVVTALLLPVFLHLHLLVPAPMLRNSVRHGITLPLYALALVLAAIDIFRPLPGALYNLLILLALASSVGALVVRLLDRRTSPALRLAVRLMLTGNALAFGPGLVLFVIPSLTDSVIAGQLPMVVMLIAISLQPFFYIYALYKQRLGDLEFRANRLLSVFAFLVVFVTGFMFVFVVGSQFIIFPTPALTFAFVVSVVFVTLGLFLRPPFQRLIDRLAYGTEHSANDIVRALANQIPIALNRQALVDLLIHEVTPALLIRQSALYLVDAAEVTPVYTDHTPPADCAEMADEIRDLLKTAGRYRPAEPDDPHACAWVRLAVAIEVGRRPIAVWLLGRRDPDDYYPRADVELLTTLANQIGVALENTRLIENLQHRATELERAYSELQELDRLKDEFVQNVSHELRTPLTIIQTSGELLLEELVGELNADQRMVVERLTERTKSMVRLVNDILTLQQTTVERMAREPVNLAALGRACLEEARIMAQQPEYKARLYHFSFEAPQDLPLVMGDRNRLRQVLDNLLSNALKFSPDGGAICIDIRTCTYHFGARDDSDTPAVKVTVSDEGIGIPVDQMDRIWRRFYQVDGSSTRRFGGTGLGLAIVRSIISAHGGAIWAESIEGKGSAFRFVLPAVEPMALMAPVQPLAMTGMAL